MLNGKCRDVIIHVTDATVQRGAASWNQERTHRITYPPSVDPCLLRLIVFQTRNGGLNTVTAFAINYLRFGQLF